MAVTPVTFADLRTTRRNAARQQAAGKRQYAAAKVTRLTGDWMPVSQSVNEIIRSSAPQLRSRIRQLVRDFPYFARAVNILVDFTVGAGTNFQSRVLNPKWQPGVAGQSKFDRPTCQRIEDAVAWWMDEADAAGRQHFSELERLANRQETEVGQFLFVKTAVKDPKRYIPFALQSYEIDWLTDRQAKPEGANLIEQGREYDPQTGRIVAYHFADPWGWGAARRVPAEFVLSGFDVQRPGQLVGVSPFVTAVLIAHDLNDYLDATIDTAKLAARYLAMVETADPASFQAMRAMDGAGADEGKKLESIEHAIIEYLRPGEKIHFAKNEATGQTFDPFTRFILQMLAIATNTPYSLLSGNHAGYNYTSLRGERQDLLKTFAPRQQRHVRSFAAPAVQEAIEQAVLSGKLDLPGYFRNPRAFWRAVYIPPGMEPIDPLRESKANRDDIAAGLRSPQEIVARRGRDLEEVLDEIAEAQELAAERRLVFESGSTSLANNPAALDAAEDDRSARARRIAQDAAERAVLLMEE